MPLIFILSNNTQGWGFTCDKRNFSEKCSKMCSVRLTSTLSLHDYLICLTMDLKVPQLTTKPLAVGT